MEQRERSFDVEFGDAFDLIPNFPVDRVKAAKILLVGVGALGNEVAKNLALYNVLYLYLCDLDTVEWANLSHSVLFRKEDDKRPKVFAAQRTLQELNPRLQVRPFYGTLTDIGIGVIRAMDLVIGGLDNRGSRLLIDRMCARAGKPWIDAGLGAMIEGDNPAEGILRGTVKAFSPRLGYSYEGYMQPESVRQAAEQEAAGARKAWRNWPGCYEISRALLQQQRVPTTPTMASLIGAIQAQEAIRHLAPEAWGPGGVGFRSLTIDMARMSIRMMEHPRCAPVPPAEPVVAMSSWTARNTRLAEVMERARQDLGNRAIVRLGFQYCTGLQCDRCNTIERRPFKIGSVNEICPGCHLPRSPLPGEPMPDYLNGSEPFLDMTLHALGVPMFDVLTVQRWEGRDSLAAEMHYELTGDRDEALQLRAPEPVST